MIATEVVHNLNATLSMKRENIVQRIMDLSDEQFERLITLYSQQEKELCPTAPTQHRTSA